MRSAAGLCTSQVPVRPCALLQDYRDLEGPQIPVPGGYQSLAERFAAMLPLGAVRLGCRVTSIDYSEQQGPGVLLAVMGQDGQQVGAAPICAGAAALRMTGAMLELQNSAARRRHAAHSPCSGGLTADTGPCCPSPFPAIWGRSGIHMAVCRGCAQLGSRATRQGAIAYPCSLCLLAYSGGEGGGGARVVRVGCAGDSACMQLLSMHAPG
jgi:hypothetical protein